MKTFYAVQATGNGHTLIRGQYEQRRNAAALKEFNVPIIDDIDKKFSKTVTNWLHQPQPKIFGLNHSTEEIVSIVMKQFELF